MLNLFALTTDPNERILRFALSQDVQAELTTSLLAQEIDFNKHSAEIYFDGKYKPELGEVLYIDDFDDIDKILDAIKNPMSFSEVDPDPATFSRICALFSGYVTPTGEVVALIQHFEKRKIISTNGLSIFHAGNVYKKVEGIGLTIDNRLSAILSGKRLKFYSFHIARQLFDLSGHYKEATESDIKEFAALACVSVPDEKKLIDMSDTWVRRKLWLIQQSGILQKYPIHQIKTVAVEFNVPLETISEDGTEKIVVPDDKATFKSILRFLDEDYYKSPLSKTRYLTNSKRLAQ